MSMQNLYSNTMRLDSHFVDASHFRYIDGESSYSFEFGGKAYYPPQLIEFRTLKETPCGFWIYQISDWRNNKRWVSKTSRKRYAYPTVEEALDSYLIRKRKQIGYAEDTIERANDMIQAIMDAIREKKKGLI